MAKKIVKTLTQETVQETGLITNLVFVRLDVYAKACKIKMEEAEKRLAVKAKEIQEGVEEQYKPDVLGRLAVNALLNDVRREKARQLPNPKRKETLIMYGFMTGDSGIWDKADTVRRQVKKFIDKNGLQAAIEAQMVDGDNNILDQRQKIYGRENKNYLKPLDPNLKVLERTMYGFFRSNGTKDFKWGSIQTADNKLARAWKDVKFYKPFQVPAIVKEETAEDIKLGSSSAEGTVSVFKALKEDWDIQKIIEETLGPKQVKDPETGEVKKIPEQWTAIKEVEKHHEAFKDAWDRRIFVKGIVAWINLDRPTPINSIKMGLMNPENEEELVTVEIPETVPIDFGELSEVYVFGKTRRSKYRDQESQKIVDGDVVIGAHGIYPTFKTPKAGRGGEVEEEIIEGWIH
jgi:hypothetical protein